MLIIVFLLPDIDECYIGSHDCHSNAFCNDTDGYFICTCYAGYDGDGVNCTSKAQYDYYIFGVTVYIPRNGNYLV